MKKTLKWSFVMILSVMGLTFTSCGDDDETPVVPTEKEVVGDYSGKMTFEMVQPKEAAEDATTTLDLAVTADSVTFKKFPYEALVVAIVGEKDAPALIEKIGELKYAAAYKATMNAAKDSITLTMTPAPLKIETEGLSVSVTITAADNGTYAIKDKNLKFKLSATEAKIGEMNFLPTPINLSFNMVKK